MSSPLRRPTAALALAALLALSGCAADPDDWSQARSGPLDASAAVGAQFIDPQHLPAPGGTATPAPTSYAGVHPPHGYRVVLLRQGDGPETTHVADAVTAWAKAEELSLKTVTVTDREGQVDGIVQAMGLGADLIVAAGPDLVDALAVVTASNLDQQFLVVGAQLPEPTDNVTAAIWPGADTRGSEIAGEQPDAAAFNAQKADAAVHAGVAAVLSGYTGYVLEV